MADAAACLNRPNRGTSPPPCLDAACLVGDLRDLRAARSARLPVYDFATHTRAAATQPLAPRPVVLVAGIFALDLPALPDSLALRNQFRITTEFKEFR